MRQAAAVAVHGVGHRYGDRVALAGVDFTVEHGTFFGLLGPNGGGKTTLFRILSTLLRPTEGTASVAGFDTHTHAAEVRRRLGVVFQTPALDAHLSVRENLRVHGALYGLARAEVDRRLADLLPRFGLEARAGDRVKTLSGGLARRADLVRGLLHAPPVLLLDEPTTGLDPAARRAFWDALATLRADEGTTVLLATHLLDEADACDVVGILDEGHLAALGPPDTLKRALGDATLWLDTPDPAALARRLDTHLGLSADVIGPRLRLVHPDAPALLPALYEAVGDALTAATVRRPTLEDVFLVHTGHALGADARF